MCSLFVFHLITLFYFSTFCSSPQCLHYFLVWFISNLIDGCDWCNSHLRWWIDWETPCFVNWLIFYNFFLLIVFLIVNLEWFDLIVLMICFLNCLTIVSFYFWVNCFIILRILFAFHLINGIVSNYYTLFLIFILTLINTQYVYFSILVIGCTLLIVFLKMIMYFMYFPLTIVLLCYQLIFCIFISVLIALYLLSLKSFYSFP